MATVVPAVVLVALFVALRGGGGAGHRDPLAGDRFFVDPATPVVAAVQSHAVPPADVRLLRRITTVPSARWFGDWIPSREVTGQVADFVTLAARAHRVPVLVVYDIVHRDCSGASRGGAPTAAAYRAFVRSFVAGLGSRPSVVVVEPDALAQLTCLDPADQAHRVALLRYAVGRLDRRPAVSTYLDAGNSQFVPAGQMAARLRRADVARTAGFALDVSNFFTTGTETAYGQAISKRVGGAHFVIDTSRNGRGAATGPMAWCNPPGRALGHVPTTDTGNHLVDAWLWIKTPGVSDGPCRPGAPPAGDFWLPYALGLAGRATG